ncbi:MAG: hypothetical protein M1343_06930 [Chloroflexi bacterium]|nr:hypothetical protein [Chloroflexota bacterium]MDA8189766.1 hypothetical protein [Dehalococcoidales bacterium]
MPPRYLGPPNVVGRYSNDDEQQVRVRHDCPAGYRLDQDGACSLVAKPALPPQPDTSEVEITRLWAWVKENPVSAIVVAGGSYYVLKLVKRKIR